MAKVVRKLVRLDLIDRPDTLARVEIDDSSINELAESIRERGLQNPIKVAVRGERFEIIFGDRRYLAHKRLGLDKIEATIVEASEGEILIDRAVENLQRVDLSPMEEALQYRGMVDRGGMSVEEVARKVGKRVGTVERRMKMLQWPEEFMSAVHKRLVSISVAEELMACTEESKRSYFLEMAVEHGITSTVARMWVSDWRKSMAPRPSGAVEGGGGGGLSFERKIYIGCDLCESPHEYQDLKHINVCDECLAQLKRILDGGSK